MKSIALLALAASSAAWVLPDQPVFMELPEDAGPQEGWPRSWMKKLEHDFSSAIQSVSDGFEDAVGEISKANHKCTFRKVIDGMEAPLGHPKTSDKTVYEVIAESGYADKFVKLLDQFEDVRDLLNSSDADVTVFVPTDKAFERIPHHGDDDDDKDKDGDDDDDDDDDKKKPPKWFLEALLKSHIVRGSYSSRDLFRQHTLPTLLDGHHLSEDGSKTPQRLAVKVGWRGIYINNYNRVVHRDFKASNGVVHGMHNFNLPPPPLRAVVAIAPTAFSQFELGLIKSGLGHVAHHAHRGATVFAPANGAWGRLGFKANAFLFSPWGRKYLKSLLAYHIVANQTLYSDAYYGADAGKGDGENDEALNTIPKGRWHVDLPTLLHGQHVSVDIGRYGRWIDMHVNHYSKVVFQDAIGHDGVIHVINRILIPHHKKHGEAKDGEITVEELRERLEPFVDHADDSDDGAAAHSPELPSWVNVEL